MFDVSTILSLQVPNATNLLNWFVGLLGPFAIVGVCVVVFAETGLLIGFFLPGDSLLFLLGVFIGTDVIKQPLYLVLILIPICAVAGVQSGYWIGRRAGDTIFNKKDSKLFKKKYVDKTRNFYKKHGVAAVFLSQFVPIVRTFSPVAAGVSKMKYSKFFAYNVGASIVWGVGFPLLGFVFADNSTTGAFIEKHVDLITLLIILLSIIPIIIKAIADKKRDKKKSDN